MSFTLPQVRLDERTRPLLTNLVFISNPDLPCMHLACRAQCIKGSYCLDQPTNQPAMGNLRRDDEPKELQCVFVFFVLALFCIDGVISLETTLGQCTQVFKGAYR